MKVALVYDRVNKWGGAERVLLALHELFPKAPLYTSVYDVKKAAWAQAFTVKTSFLQKLPLPKDRHELYPFLMGPAFETFNFDEFDVVITVTSEYAKAIVTKPKTIHICLCLTPTGYLWSNHDNYFASKDELFKLIARPIIAYLRFYDKVIASRPDFYIAISEAVQERIKTYYDKESIVIYPPVEVGGLNDKKFASEDFYLIVARLVPNKRVDIAIDAFNSLGIPLKIVGIGTEMEKLKKRAKSNIEFLGHLTDEKLASYYRRARGLIVPGVEDFGIVALEAQSYGKGVIAPNDSGAKETIVSKKTGLLYDNNSVRGLIQAVEEFQKLILNPKDCQSQAKKFSKKRFQKEIKEYIEMVAQKEKNNAL